MQRVSRAAVGVEAKQISADLVLQETAVGVPGKEGLIVRSSEFLDLETPAEYLSTWLTPNERFFVRNHAHTPTLDCQRWRLSITGEVRKPYTLTLDELSRLETHSQVNTMECAGNGRAFHDPTVPGAQWHKGAVGTARFMGPRLQAVLERAGIKPNGKHVVFRGLDDPSDKAPLFIRSIPIEKALDGDTLIATHMNDAVLGPHHGFPARALVPGWIGAASCKWLTEIKVVDREFDGPFMAREYRLSDHPVTPGEAVRYENTTAITALGVKSLITSPADGTVVKSRAFRISGVAWAGEAEVAYVEISVDGGASWQKARLGHEHARYAWRLFTFEWNAPHPGHFAIAARAADSYGRTQPLTPLWNPNGYMNNGVDRVRVRVQA